MKLPRLSTREMAVLALLAQGDNLKEIKDYFGISLENVHTICCTLRKKTGIRQTRDAEECKRYLAKLDQSLVERALYPPAAPPPLPLTDCQLEAMRLLASGRTYQQIATFLGILPQSVQNLLTRACKCAGITHAGWNRTRYIKEYLARRDGHLPPAPVNPMADPMF
jgi:DNA-binding CsgD family transcriptional regulator